MNIRCAEDNVVLPLNQMAAVYGVSESRLVAVCKKPGSTANGKHFHYNYESENGEKYRQNFDYLFLKK